jgi:phospholipase D1/2
MHRSARLRTVSIALALVGLALVAWQWLPVGSVDPQSISAWFAPYRHAWYALPLVMAAFIVLALVPVMLLVAATGVAFGPVLGPVYAMAGCLASASVAFLIGRWMGLKRVEHLGGERVVRVAREVRRNGTLAVFLIRKIPAPFTFVNIVIGASSIRYRDFLVGSTLGMAAMVVALAGFGYQLTEIVRNPTPRTVITSALVLAVLVTLAWVVNRALRPSEVG